MRRVLASLGLIGVLSLALAVSGEEVMKKVDARPSPSAMHGVMVMQLVNKQGKTLTRKIELWTRKVGDEEKMLIKFLAPADVRGTAFLALKKGGKEEMKLYLPALKRIRRIAGSQKKGSFMGSDFTYDDISNLGGMKIEDYNHKLLKTEEGAGGKVFVVESTPKPGVESSYSKLVVWVPEATYVPTRIEFYKKGKLYKVLQSSKIESFADGKYLIPTYLVMENVKTKHKTILEQQDLEIDVEIPDSVFSERFMKR